MKKIIFLISCFFVMMDVSRAVTLTCPGEASPGEEIKLHIEEQEYIGIKAKYQFGDGFVYQNMKLNSSWKSYYNGADGFSIGNVSNQDKLSMDVNVKIDMNLAVNKEYTLQLVELEGSKDDYKNNNLDNISCKIKLLSNVDTLNNLEISNGTLSPKFDKNTLRYEAVVDRDTTVIKATPSDKNAKVEGDIGEKKLNYGVNTFVVKVTSVRGTQKVYNIYITRPLKVVSDKIDKSSDATLKSLTLSTGKIAFKKDNFLYSVNVGYEVENIEVEAVTNSDKAKFEINKPDKLVVGDNTIKVIVTAEDGTVATYVVVVNRKEKLSSDATIKNLVIKNYSIDFKADDYEYDLEIDGEDKLDIEVILNDDRANYKIKGNNNLKNNSIIEIEVIAEDGSNNIYKINIIKLSESNSDAISNYIKFVPLIGFIVLIVAVLVVKILKSKANSVDDKNA
ncbi:MAG: cadherin-like beta sandwich domain-containing protein [Bacilli bacterium]|nr:cadherin-like beta sandwich domain-containing protein [Bacilli bacterium]